jgi:flagellin-like protein
MPLNPAAQLPTRTIAMLTLAAFAAITVWMFAPSGGDTSWGGTDSTASLAPSLAVDGEVQVTSAGDSVTQLVVPLAVRGEDGILLTEGRRLHATTVMSESASAAVPADYSVAWSNGNGDEVLDPGEQAVLTVDLPSPSSVHPGNPIDLIIRPVEGVALTVSIFE